MLRSLGGMLGMSDVRVRIKVGENEFEANGPPEFVQAEIAGFKKLIGYKADPAANNPQSERADIEKVARINGRVVSLKVRTKSPVHSVLAVLLGQHLLRNNTKVMGSEIMDGLRQSGYDISRADNILRDHVASANVTVVGRHRRRRYQLTPRGIEKAQAVARVLLAALPPDQPANPKD
jgi:hypothetical protein